MNDEVLLLAPMLVPAVGAAVGFVFRTRPRLQLATTCVALATTVAVGVGLTAETLSRRVVCATIGADTPIAGVALTAEPLGASLVTAVALLAALVVVTTVSGDEASHPYRYPLFLVLLAGACGSFVAGDLFNLFVLFEIALSASYVLLVLDGSFQRLRAGSVFILVNLLGTMLFLAGVAGVLATTGTVNLAVLASGAGAEPMARSGAALVVLAFAVKAGLLPFTGWLVVGYSNARRPTMALFVGSLSTVGVAALYRVVLLGFGGAAEFRHAVLGAGMATLVLAPIAAVGAGRHARAIALLVATQVGFMAIGFGLGTFASVSAGVFFVLQDVLVKTALVLSYGPLHEDGVEHGVRSEPRARDLAPLCLLALSLAGLPPLVGFVGKALLVEAALAANAPWVAAVALGASALALAAFLRLWRRARISPASDGLTTAATGVVALGVLAVGVAPQWLISISESSAKVLLDPEAYARIVLGGAP